MIEHRITENGAEIIIGTCFDIKNTFDCGQCFRWDENPDGSFTGIVRNKKATVSRNGDTVIISGASDADFTDLWNDYLDLDTEYDAIRKEIAAVSPVMRSAVDCINGIRILRQEPWEALCSFIISQNNNIPRIKGIISRLCENFGDRCEDGFTFPSAQIIASLSPDDLAPLRCGFRTRYILDAAYKVSSGKVELEKMYTAPIDECRSELMTIVGVGTKVAECTLLYGFHRLDAFPVDVWMKKALSTVFEGITPDKFGSYAGIAQQYIFHYMRTVSDSRQ